MSTIEAGLPVEIGRIDQELGKLWEESGDTKTRASLINLADLHRERRHRRRQYRAHLRNRGRARLPRHPHLGQA